MKEYDCITVVVAYRYGDCPFLFLKRHYKGKRGNGEQNQMFVPANIQILFMFVGGYFFFLRLRGEEEKKRFFLFLMGGGVLCRRAEMKCAERLRQPERWTNPSWIYPTRLVFPSRHIPPPPTPTLQEKKRLKPSLSSCWPLITV